MDKRRVSTTSATDITCYCGWSILIRHNQVSAKCPYCEACFAKDGTDWYQTIPGWLEQPSKGWSGKFDGMMMLKG